MPDSTTPTDPGDTSPWSPSPAQNSSRAETTGAASTRPTAVTSPWATTPEGPLRHAGSRWPAACAVLVICLAYALYLGRHVEPAISTPDANGYWAQGTLLARTGHTWFRSQSPLQYIGMHWLILPDGRYVSRYPPGLPVLIAGVYKLFGAEATVWVNPVLAVLSLVGLFFFSKRFVPDRWAVVPVLLLAITPSFTRHTLSCDSHMAVLFCLVWGLSSLLLWAENGRLAAVFAAGLLLGAIPTIRYPEALFAIGVGAFLLFHHRTHKRYWLHLLVAVAGAAIPILPLLVRNQLLMGAFWRTGYSLTNEQTGFAWSYFREHVFQYIRNIHAEGVGLFFALGVLGMAALCGVRKYRARGWLLILTTVPTTVLYMFYYWAPDRMAGATMRFVLPTFICYYAAGAWVLAEMTRRLPRSQTIAGLAALLLLQVLWGGPQAYGDTGRILYPKKVLVRITRALEKTAPAGAVILSAGLDRQHLDFVGKWKVADAELFRERPGGFRRLSRRRQTDPDAPQPMQAKKRELRGKEYAGLSPLERQEEMAKDLFAWANGQKVYFVGPEDQLNDVPDPCFRRENFRIVKRIPLPAAPPMPKRGRFGRMPGGPPAGGGPRPIKTDGMAPRNPADRFGPPAGPPAPGRPFAGLRNDPRVKRFLRRVGGVMGGLTAYLDERELIIAEWTWTPDKEKPGKTQRPSLRNPFRKPRSWGAWRK